MARDAWSWLLAATLLAACNGGGSSEVGVTGLQLSFTSPPSSLARVGSPWSRDLRVELRDDRGRLRTSDDQTAIRLEPRSGSPAIQGTLTRTLKDGVAVFDDLVFAAAGAAVLDFVSLADVRPVNASETSGVSVAVVDRPWSFAASDAQLVYQGPPPSGEAPLELRDVNGDAKPDLLHRGVFLQQPGTGQFVRSEAFSALTGKLIDLNGDGFADRFVVDFGTVGIAFQDPQNPGSFANVVTTPLNTSQIDWGDLDGDGSLEVVALQSGGVGVDPRIAVYGLDVAVPGQLLLRTSFDVPGTPVGVSVRVANADGDAFPDLLVVLMNWTSPGPEWNSLYRVRQDPLVPGSFLLPQLIDAHSVNSPISSFVAHDVTGDGLPDGVYVADGVVYYHDSFGPRTQWVPATDIRFTDLDGDGHADAALDNASLSGPPIAPTVTFFRFDPAYTGGPPAMRPIVTLPKTPSMVYALADLNGDSRADLVSSVVEASQYQFVQVTLQDPAPAEEAELFPWPRQIEGPGLLPSPTLVALADFDRDGEDDYVFASPSSASLQVARNVPGPSVSFETPQNIVLPEQPGRLAIGDLDGDGWPDLVVPTLGDTIPETGLVVLRNDPNATAGERFSIRTFLPGSFLDVQIVDVDGDGRPDLAFRTLELAFGWFRQDAAGAFQETAPRLTPNSQYRSFTVDDLDRDGRAELVLVYSDHVDVWLQNVADGSFRSPITTFLDALGQSEANDLAIADIDGDGDRDLVIADPGIRGFDVVRTFAVPSEPPTFVREGNTLPFPSNVLRLVDVDGDGRPEVVTRAIGNAVTTVSVMGGPGELIDVRHFGGALPELLGDLDGDGVKDLVAFPFATMGR
jgi:hypothetical protein